MSRWIVLVMAVAGCSRSYDEQQAARGSAGSCAPTVVTAARAPAGTERGDCRPDGGCDGPLACLSNVCVRMPSADCGPVAEAMASFDLGNYATREERAPVVAAKRKACEAAVLTTDEGKCIAAARAKAAALACAPRLADPTLPPPPPPPPPAGDGSASLCAPAAAKLRSIIAVSLGGTTNPAMTATIDTTTAAVRASCEQDGWPLALQQCMLAANTEADMKACEPKMPPGLQQKLQNRMTAAMHIAPTR